VTGISVAGLCHAFAGVTALRGVAFDVQAGELFGLVGPDGAGKSTTIRCLAGLIAPDAGTVRVLGLDPIAQGSTLRERLGLMPQQYSLYGDLSVAENLRFYGDLFCLRRREREERTERLLAITRLAPFTERRSDALSGGMYKKLALACALLHRPAALLLDEPTNGVDPVSRRELWDLLYEFVGEGMAVLVSTPYMDEAERCHRVALIHEGRVLTHGVPRRLNAEFDHDVLAVPIRAEGRAPVEALLRANPSVRAWSPAGTRIRVVVRREGTGPLVAALRAQGLHPEPARPDFEDLFLARVAEAS
jgi:ABC-2 type transport system ATP-binding protein